MPRLAQLVAGVALALTAGCNTLDTQLNPKYDGPYVYSGVRMDYEMIGKGYLMGSGSMVMLGLFDSPFSLVGDTLLLPISIPREMRRVEVVSEQLQVERDRPAPVLALSGEAPADAAKRLFDACRERLRKMNSGFEDCYAVDARIALVGGEPLRGSQYKLVVREAFERNQSSGVFVDWRDPSFAPEAERVRIRATRRSTAEPAESALELVVALGPDGGWRIVEEASVGFPEP